MDLQLTLIQLILFAIGASLVVCFLTFVVANICYGRQPLWRFSKLMLRTIVFGLLIAGALIYVGYKHLPRNIEIYDGGETVTRYGINIQSYQHRNRVLLTNKTAQEELFYIQTGEGQNGKEATFEVISKDIPLEVYGVPKAYLVKAADAKAQNLMPIVVTEAEAKTYFGGAADWRTVRNIYYRTEMQEKEIEDLIRQKTEEAKRKDTIAAKLKTSIHPEVVVDSALKMKP